MRASLLAIVLLAACADERDHHDPRDDKADGLRGDSATDEVDDGAGAPDAGPLQCPTLETPDCDGGRAVAVVEGQCVVGYECVACVDAEPFPCAGTFVPEPIFDASGDCVIAWQCVPGDLL